MEPTMLRRQLLRLGAGLGGGGRSHAAAAAARNPRPARACILLYMAGGPSHIDTFDPKPGRKGGGPFKAIATKVDGVFFSEHLPRLAARCDRLALLRSMTTKEGNHDRARHLMHTGYAPQGGADHPGFGALVSEARARPGLPGYVAIGGPGKDAGFLSAAHSPFPVKNATKPVRYLTPAKGLPDERFARRIDLLRGLEGRFEARGGGFARARREVLDQAVGLMRSPLAAAFDLGPEPEAARAPYGPSDFGQGCLMARRLVEAGVPFVEVTLNGWDTHEDNFRRVEALSAVLDQAMSALLDDLAARGLLDSTLVLWTGDFGRTPRINERGGRDHFPGVFSTVLCGGGVKGGCVVGASDEDGAAVAASPVTVQDLYRTAAWLLDVDADKVRYAPSGRPIKAVDGGRLVTDLLA
jgi:hypothetical protein